MIHAHCSTANQRAQWVSALIAQEGTYGVVSQMSRTYGVSRQSLYSWKAKGQSVLQAAFEAKEPQPETAPELERAVLTFLVEGHASYRGIQRCLEILLGGHVSVGKIAAIVQSAGQRAQQWLSRQVPPPARGLALDELYGSMHGEGYLNVVDVHSGVVWARRPPHNMLYVDGQ